MKPTKTKTGKARVLTSAQCLSILKEKQEKKKREAEEKEKRLQERLQKRQEREKEMKRKSEKRAQKAVESEKVKKQKESSGAKNCVPKRTPIAGPEASPCSKVSTAVRSARKRLRLDVDTLDSTIYSNLCCVCFGSYEEDEGTGRQWLKCICERWIHEDCIIDTGDRNKLCPLC